MTDGTISGDLLASYMDRIERLEEEKAALTSDIREVYSEARGKGFDTKIMRQIIRLRAMDAHDLQEQDHLLRTYRTALGMGGGPAPPE